MKPGGALLVTVVLLAGCGLEHLRPYARWEAAQFSGVSLPAAGEIRSGAHALNEVRYEQDFERVWFACVRLAMQGAGILGTAGGVGGEGRLLFVASVPRTFIAPYAHRFAGEVLLDQVESWIAIGVHADGNGGTRVSLASVDPRTGLLLETANGDAEDDTARVRREVARSAAVNFQVALAAQLRAPQLAARLGPLPTGDPRRGGPPPVATPRAAWASYAKRHGDYISAIARSQLYLVDDAQLTRHLNEIAQRLLRAAGAPQTPLRVYVHAAQSGQPAFSLGNGDLFVNSLLLEPPNDVGHVAAILAHEIDHVIQQDHIKREEQRSLDGNRKMNLLVGATAVTMTAVIADDPDIWFEDSGETDDAATRLVGVAAIAGAMFASGVVGTEVGEIALSDYSAEQELRADRNAAIYLWRAGFRPRALLEILER